MAAHNVDFVLVDAQEWMPRELQLHCADEDVRMVYVRDVRLESQDALQIVVPAFSESARVALDVLVALVRAARRNEIKLLPCFLDVHATGAVALLAYVEHTPDVRATARLNAALDAPSTHVLAASDLETLLGYTCSTKHVVTCVTAARVHKVYVGPAFCAGARELVLLDTLADASRDADAAFPMLLHVAVHVGTYVSTLVLSETRMHGEHYDVVVCAPAASGAQVRDACVQLACALAQLDARGIVHGDLLAQNILVNVLPSGEWRLALVDFGNAGLLPMQSETQRTDRYAFAPAQLPKDAPLVDYVLARQPWQYQFYAPELCRSGCVDHGTPCTRADIWSAAFLIAQAAARGRVAADYAAQLARVQIGGHVSLTMAPRMLDGTRVSYTPALQALLDACLACEPAARPSAAELAAALASLTPEDYNAHFEPA